MKETTTNIRSEATQRVMAAKLTRFTQNSDTTAPSGRELYHLQFLLQAASPETFGYTLLYREKPLTALTDSANDKFHWLIYIKY
jgi:hypothetical protein